MRAWRKLKQMITNIIEIFFLNTIFHTILSK